jgi:hypothetical protein
MLSRIVNTTVDIMYEKVLPLMEVLQAPWLDAQKIAATLGDVCPLQNCVGFIDGTVRPICRPKYEQERVYNGHKRRHAMKYQGIFLGNGIMLLYGPWERRRHDAHLLTQSGVLHQLASLPRNASGTAYCLYGDPAYPLLEQIQGLFKCSPLAPEQRAFNEAMSEWRKIVEFGFGKIVQYFSFVDYHKNMKLFLSPIAKYYILADFFTNCHTCLYGFTMNSKNEALLKNMLTCKQFPNS